MNNYRGPGIYRHYKGGTYGVLGLGVREETVVKPDDDDGISEYPEPVIVVIYRPLSPGSLLTSVFENVSYWTRDLEDFNSDVSVPDAKGIGMTQARFTFMQGPP